MILGMIICIADSQMRKLLVQLCEKNVNIKVVGKVPNGLEVIKMVHEKRPDGY